MVKGNADAFWIYITAYIIEVYVSIEAVQIILISGAFLRK